jgi:hypothetical protein
LALPLPAVVEVGNVPGCIYGQTDPRPYLDAYHATVLRVIVSETDPGDPWPCVQTAVSEGFRVHLVLQWANTDTTGQVAAFVEQQLQELQQPVWAVSLGNEQELNQGGVPEWPWEYSDAWKAAEPVARDLQPAAILVAGEISPWGMGWFQQAWNAGLPGAQAVSAHPYDVAGAFAPADFLGWAQSVGQPAWFDEALAGPHAWPTGTMTLSAGQLAGAQVAGAWWDGTALS